MGTEATSKAGDRDIVVTKFDDDAAIKFREKILRQSEQNPHLPIVIYISSYGGYLDSLASMVETIEEVPNPIVTVCLGHAMSCGAILFSFGDFRFIGRHSRIMIHEVSGGAIGDTHDVYADAEHLKEMNQYWIGQMAKNCGFDGYSDFRSHLKDRDGRNIWLTAQQAVKFGIADFVGMPHAQEVCSFEIRIKSERQKPERKPSIYSKSKKKSKKKTTRKKKTARKTRKKSIKTSASAESIKPSSNGGNNE